MKVVISFVAAAFGLAASCVLAANVEVVDRSVNDLNQQAGQYRSGGVITTTTINNTSEVSSSIEPGQSVSSSSSGKNISAEMFYQFQVMQQEVLELRGLVEEQAHQIKQLKQQRLDDYVDLDRRLSALGKGSTGAGSSTSLSAPSSGNVIFSNASAGANDEKSNYQAAIDPIIGSNKDLDLAISLLNKHLERFPSGRFTANAKYWLGETYLVKDDLPESRKWFEQLLNEFPLHDKVPAAKLKLGIVYHKLGMNAQSRVLLQEVRASGGPAATRAGDYLDANF